MAEKDINLKQVLKRFPPGDRWTPTDSDQPIFSNLTEGIEWVFQSTQERDYVIKAGEITQHFIDNPPTHIQFQRSKTWKLEILLERKKNCSRNDECSPHLFVDFTDLCIKSSRSMELEGVESKYEFKLTE